MDRLKIALAVNASVQLNRETVRFPLHPPRRR